MVWGQDSDFSLADWASEQYYDFLYWMFPENDFVQLVWGNSSWVNVELFAVRIIWRCKLSHYGFCVVKDYVVATGLFGVIYCAHVWGPPMLTTHHKWYADDRGSNNRSEKTSSPYFEFNDTIMSYSTYPVWPPWISSHTFKLKCHFWWQVCLTS